MLQLCCKLQIIITTLLMVDIYCGNRTNLKITILRKRGAKTDN